MDSIQYHRDRRQAEMRSYSRTIRWMKVVLPISAILLIGLIFLAGRDRFDATPAQQVVSAAALGAGLKLENPRFAGVTSDGDPYVVTALSALPDGASPDRIELEEPEGELRLKDGMVLTVESIHGEMFRQKELLNLEGDVILRTSDGYRADSTRVEMDMANRITIVPERLIAKGPRGEIEADRLRVEQTGKTNKDIKALFTGNVRVILNPEQ
ncbi:MAG: hypothetical protein AAF479_08925 [Pseudomonadota bacterium]